MKGLSHYKPVGPHFIEGSSELLAENHWYAVHTRSRFENKVYNGFISKSIRAFLPRVQVMSRRKDRRKKIMVPMLPGYIFVNVRMDPYTYWDIIKTVGVVRIVNFKGIPVPAKEEEISNLMILDGTDRTVQNRSYMRRGDRVMIMEGPFKGLVGIYVRHKNKADRVVINIELLNRSMEVELEDWLLEKIP